MKNIIKSAKSVKQNSSYNSSALALSKNNVDSNVVKYVKMKVVGEDKAANKIS